MKVGDLVKLSSVAAHDHWNSSATGIIVGFAPGSEPALDYFCDKNESPIVYWSEEFSSEVEHQHHIEVISEAGKSS